MWKNGELGFSGAFFGVDFFLSENREFFLSLTLMSIRSSDLFFQVNRKAFFQVLGLQILSSVIFRVMFKQRSLLGSRVD